MSDLDELHPAAITFFKSMLSKALDVSVHSMLQFDRLSSSTSLQSLSSVLLHDVRLLERCIGKDNSLVLVRTIRSS
jgi:hypothetical protein